MPFSGVDYNYYNQVASKEYSAHPGVYLDNGIFYDLEFEIKDCNEYFIVDEQLRLILNIEITD